MHIKSFNNCSMVGSISTHFWPLASSIQFSFSFALYLHTISNVPTKHLNVACVSICYILYSVTFLHNSAHRFNSFFLIFAYNFFVQTYDNLFSHFFLLIGIWHATIYYMITNITQNKNVCIFLY